MPDQSATSWADTAASLLTKLSGGVELNLAFDQVELQVPNQANPAGLPATWKLNGSLRIRTARRGAPAAARAHRIARARPQRPAWLARHRSRGPADAHLAGRARNSAGGGRLLPHPQRAQPAGARPDYQRPAPAAGHARRPPKSPAPTRLQQLHHLARRLGLVLDLRVAGKTYVTFGLPDRDSPKITLHAVLGKIGSFFK
ncbi:MAG: hypothetical protein WKG07_04545 [Hymenobacter sp.]